MRGADPKPCDDCGLKGGVAVEGTEKSSAWSEDERERDPVAAAIAPQSLEEALANCPPPPWLDQFEPGELMLHRGWWARVLHAAPMPTPEGVQWMVLVRVEGPTGKEKKRLAMRAATANVVRDTVRR